MQLGRKLAEGYAVDISEEAPGPDITSETAESPEPVTATQPAEPAQV